MRYSINNSSSCKKNSSSQLPTYFANVLLEHDSKQLHNSSSLHMWLKKWAHLCVPLLHANSENKGGKTSSHFWIITNQNYEEFLENTWNALVRWRSTIEITYLPNVISLYVCYYSHVCVILNMLLLYRTSTETKWES